MKETVPKCLGAFYSRPGADETHSNLVKAHTGAGERLQEIYTPQEIIDSILRVWGSIEFDACSGPNSIVPARRAAYVAPQWRKTKSGKEVVYYEAQEGDIDGLEVSWPDRTYCNPPYKFLRAWLEKAEREGTNGHETEIMVLCPNRTSRRWFRRTKRTCATVIELDPVKFVGYKSANPDRLVLMYWGGMPSLVELAFEHMGDPAWVR